MKTGLFLVILNTKKEIHVETPMAKTRTLSCFPSGEQKIRIQDVEIDSENSTVTVTGKFDAKEVLRWIVKKTSKKVEMISPTTAIKHEMSKTTEEEKGKEMAVLKTTVINVPMHCESCEQDLRSKLLKIKDREKQTCIVDGIIDPHKLITHINKKMQKHASIVLEEIKKVEEKRAVTDDDSMKCDASNNVYACNMLSDENPNACCVM
ncbi:hypothetical protein QJS10_CPA01g02915 [Acorus calamus]|uniref:HMA domain-containing protein n=1 Tax=Acorus calamus TaxID=4465 RepID=A0AAV9FKL8_ACOCL|nr:hypothetical protein QJS10_CPA01g02915 [Acorus calamus]